MIDTTLTYIDKYGIERPLILKYYYSRIEEKNHIYGKIPSKIYLQTSPPNNSVFSVTNIKSMDNGDITSIDGDLIDNNYDITSIDGDSIDNNYDITSIDGDSIDNNYDITSIYGDSMDNNYDISVNSNIDYGSIDIYPIKNTNNPGIIDWFLKCSIL